MPPIHFGLAAVGPDFLEILCSHTHDSLEEARECYVALPTEVRLIYQAWVKKHGLKLCIVCVEFTEYQLNDA